MTIGKLILASKSFTRNALLEAAGLSFSCETAKIDERAVEKPLLESGISPAGIAARLAQAKALDVSARNPGAYIIGADQTMSYYEGGSLKRCHKPGSMEEARRMLLSLRGKTHRLHAAVCCAKDNQIIFQCMDEASLAMRDFSPSFLESYLSLSGEEILTSVGCYQLEGPGIQLFEKVDGNYFTVLGLPFLPLLAFLREEAVIET